MVVDFAMSERWTEVVESVGTALEDFESSGRRGREVSAADPMVAVEARLRKAGLLAGGASAVVEVPVAVERRASEEMPWR